MTPPHETPEMVMLHKLDKELATQGVVLYQIQTQQAKMVTQKEFEPVKRIVYGAVGLILVAVIGALIALVVI